MTTDPKQPVDVLAGRDPRIDPQPGDIIRQPYGGPTLAVTARTGDQVSWVRRTKTMGDRDPNTWSVRGWATRIAIKATIVKVAQTTQGPPK